MWGPRHLYNSAKNRFWGPRNGPILGARNGPILGARNGPILGSRNGPPNLKLTRRGPFLDPKMGPFLAQKRAHFWDPKICFFCKILPIFGTPKMSPAQRPENVLDMCETIPRNSKLQFRNGKRNLASATSIKKFACQAGSQHPTSI